jgi:hypothetical protein
LSSEVRVELAVIGRVENGACEGTVTFAVKLFAAGSGFGGGPS